MPVFPINFSIPEEKIIEKVTVDEMRAIKTKWLSDIIPNFQGHRGYTYATEDDYYQNYKESWFAVTCKKAGYDCLRHYEILANGCLPVFIDMDDCPHATLTHFPKCTVKIATDLFYKYNTSTVVTLDESAIEKFVGLVNSLLDHTVNYLTTKRTASYIFECMNRSIDEHTTVLFLSGETTIDYLRCLTLHGMKELLNKRCHDYPKICHLYKSDTQSSDDLYGRGFSCTKLLEDERYRDDSLDDTIVEDISNHKYTFVMYGSFHRGLPYHEEVKRAYGSKEIIYLCGEDREDNYTKHHCELTKDCYIDSFCFVRELD